MDDYGFDEYEGETPSLVTVYDPNQIGQVVLAEGDLGTVERMLPDGRYPAFADDWAGQGTLIITGGIAVFEPF